MNVNKVIKTKFRVKHGDTLPYTGWLNSTRRDLAELLAELGYQRGAEIGVAEGRFSKLLCETVPGLQLFCIDPYGAYGRISQRLCDERMDRAVKALAPFDVTFIRLPGAEALRAMPPASLDFIYIDGNHEFDSVMVEIIEAGRVVRPGGIISGHDYFEFYKSGVVGAVLAYTHAHGLEWYVTKEKEASFFWVNG